METSLPLFLYRRLQENRNHPEMPFSFLRRRGSQRGSQLSRRGSKKGSKKRPGRSINLEQLMEQMPPEQELNEKFAEVVVGSLRGHLLRDLCSLCTSLGELTPGH